MLVVADEADVAEVIGYNLVTEDWEVFATGSGADALEKVQDVRPDIVLLEIGVPRLNAWEVYRRLKEDPETRTISVIMAAGWGGGRVQPKVRKISGPPKVTDLMEALQAILTR